jgi:hypothetical protein
MVFQIFYHANLVVAVSAPVVEPLGSELGLHLGPDLRRQLFGRERLQRALGQAFGRRLRPLLSVAATPKKQRGCYHKKLQHTQKKKRKQNPLPFKQWFAAAFLDDCA